MPKLIDDDLEELAQECARGDMQQVPSILLHLDEDCERLVVERAIEIAKSIACRTG
jgi:hypothetical protein